MEDRLIYSVVYDGPATKRASKAFMRRDWLRWFRAISQQSIIGAAISMFCFWVAFREAEESGFATGLGFAAGLGILYVLVYYLVHIASALDDAAKDQGNTRWTCELTKEGYTFTDELGCQTSIPWSVLKIEHTTPDGFMVRYGKQSVLIYRKPLQDAGLEAEFVRRANEPIAI